MSHQFQREVDEGVDEENPQIIKQEHVANEYCETSNHKITYQIDRNSSEEEGDHQKEQEQNNNFIISKNDNNNINNNNINEINDQTNNQSSKYISPIKQSNRQPQIQQQQYSNSKNEQKKQPLSTNQIGATVEDVSIIPEQNVINKIQDIDYTDPKNRQILEDQFFGQNDPNKQSDELEKQDALDKAIIPKKFQYLSLFLALAGLILIIIGFIVAFSGSSTKLMKGGAFWIIGGLCCIPGIYYTYKIFRQKIAQNNEEILQAVAEIPRY